MDVELLGGGRDGHWIKESKADLEFETKYSKLKDNLHIVSNI